MGSLHFLWRKGGVCQVSLGDWEERRREGKLRFAKLNLKIIKKEEEEEEGRKDPAVKHFLN